MISKQCFRRISLIVFNLFKRFIKSMYRNTNCNLKTAYYNYISVLQIQFFNRLSYVAEFTLTVE